MRPRMRILAAFAAASLLVAACNGTDPNDDPNANYISVAGAVDCLNGGHPANIGITGADYMVKGLHYRSDTGVFKAKVKGIVVGNKIHISYNVEAQSCGHDRAGGTFTGKEAYLVCADVCQSGRLSQGTIRCKGGGYPTGFSAHYRDHHRSPHVLYAPYNGRYSFVNKFPGDDYYLIFSGCGYSGGVLVHKKYDDIVLHLLCQSYRLYGKCQTDKHPPS